MATEFKRAEKDLDDVVQRLDQVEATQAASRADFHIIESLVRKLEEDAKVFEKRRQEVIIVEDEASGGSKAVPKYYGPKMLEKVLAFEAKVGRQLDRFRNLSSTAKVFDPVVVSPTPAATNMPLQTTPISIGPKTIRESDEIVRKKQLEEEQNHAKLALAAARKLEEKGDDDPFFKEKSLYARMEFIPGIDGFARALDKVTDKTSIKHMVAILEVITKHPDNAQFRTLSLRNPSVASLLESGGVKSALACLGFKPQLIMDKKTETEGIAYFLQEPSLETDFDAWSTWFDTLKGALDVAKSVK